MMGEINYTVKKRLGFMKNALSNITLGQVFRILVGLLIAYQIISMLLKVNETRHYNREKLVHEIKKKYPKTTLNFQNIVIEDNDVKYTSGRGGGYYHESVHLKIKDGVLKEEVNYKVVLALIPVLVLSLTFLDFLSTQKIFEMTRDDGRKIMGVVIASVLFLMIGLGISNHHSDYYFSRSNPETFFSDIKKIRDTTNLTNFKKH